VGALPPATDALCAGDILVRLGHAPKNLEGAYALGELGEGRARAAPWRQEDVIALVEATRRLVAEGVLKWAHPGSRGGLLGAAQRLFDFASHPTANDVRAALGLTLGAAAAPLDGPSLLGESAPFVLAVVPADQGAAESLAQLRASIDVPVAQLGQLAEVEKSAAPALRVHARGGELDLSTGRVAAAHLWHDIVSGAKTAQGNAA